MKIAQVAPLIESVPPKKYGGTERIVSYLTEALVTQGHDVTLFASGDSQTKADLCAVVPEALRLSQTPKDPLIQHMIQLEEVVRQMHRFDVIHFHTDYFHFPLIRQIHAPHITTLHNRLDLPDLTDIFHEFSEMPVVSISDSQRIPLPNANWVATVYNGTPATYTFSEKQGQYLAFIGRFSPDKGPEHAIEIAIRSGMPLKMAAKIDRNDQEYFQHVIKPKLEHPLIEYIGEIDEQGKDDLLKDAYALLFPIQWPEPFGMVMTEAMSCGTPVIAFRRGSVPEVMREGVSGHIVDTIEEAVEKIPLLKNFDRKKCRQYFEDYFTTHHMADNYLKVYRQVLSKGMELDGSGREISIPITKDTGQSHGFAHVSLDAAVP